MDNMIAIEDTLVSEELLDKMFACDIARCKGACCIAGDSGAPLEADEPAILNSILPEVLPYLPDEGRRELKKQGVVLTDEDGDLVTPLVNGNLHCAFTIFDEMGIASCGIERAYLDGKINFRKPVSCQLYPVRVNRYKEFTAVNYHKWDICKAACSKGKKEGIAVFRFVKEALIRRFGEKWFNELEKADEINSGLKKKS